MVDGVNSYTPVGNYKVATDGMSLEFLVQLTLTERHGILETDVRNKMSNMREKNAKLKEIGEAMANITARKKEFSKSSPSSTDIIKKRLENELPQNIKAFEDMDKAKKEFSSWDDRRDLLLDSKKWGTGIEKYDKIAEWINSPACTWSAALKEATLIDVKLARLAEENGVNTGKNGDPAGFLANNNNYGSFEALEAKLNAQKDALTNDTQLDQIELQSLMGKLQNLTSLLSTMVKKFDDSHADIIRRV
jgi:hypothetical protein